MLIYEIPDVNVKPIFQLRTLGWLDLNASIISIIYNSISFSRVPICWIDVFLGLPFRNEIYSICGVVGSF